MPGPNEMLDKGFRADTAIGRFRAVVQTATENCKQADAADVQVLGFSQDEVTADDAMRGRVANVRMMGITRAEAAGAIGLFALVSVTNNGRVSTTGTNRIGRCLTPVTQAGDHIDLWLLPR